MMNHIVFGQGKDIIFLHGWGGSIDSFLGVAKYLGDRYRCCLVDFYGFGKSEIQHPLSLIDYANGIEEIMHKYSMQDVILVGHSFGGRVAILLASYLKNIKGVVLVDSAGMKPRFTIKKFLRTLKYKILKRIGGDLNKCGSPDYRALSDVMKVTFKNIVNEHLENRLNSIDCPVLIVWGKKDKDTPLYMARRLKKNIKNSGIVILNGGHYSYLDDYAKFLLIMDSFLKDVC